MIIPKLKRVKVSSEQELRNWIAKNYRQDGAYMIVTCSKKAPKKHISTAQLRDVLGEKGWIVSRSYTLDGNLVGHIVSVS